MGGMCSSKKRLPINHHDDQDHLKLKKTSTILENLERNFPKGQYYYNKIEEKYFFNINLEYYKMIKKLTVHQKK